MPNKIPSSDPPKVQVTRAGHPHNSPAGSLVKKTKSSAEDEPSRGPQPGPPARR